MIRICYRVMIKATAGGGGLGMRLAKEHDEFMKLLQVYNYKILHLNYFIAIFLSSFCF